MVRASILIVCTHNSVRSQMAEGIIRSEYSNKFDVSSGGICPGHTVHPLAIEVMKEIKIDIDDAVPKPIPLAEERKFDIVISVCDERAEHCPAMVHGVIPINYGIPDPSRLAESTTDVEMQKDYFRIARDRIRFVLRDFVRVYDETLNAKLSCEARKERFQRVYTEGLGRQLQAEIAEYGALAGHKREPMLCLPRARLSFELEEHARDTWRNVAAVLSVAVALAVLWGIGLMLVPVTLAHPQWMFIFGLVSIVLAWFLYAVLKSIQEVARPGRILDSAIYRLQKNRSTPYDEILLGGPLKKGEWRIQDVLNIPPTIFLLLGLRSRSEVGGPRWVILFCLICLVSGALSVGLLFFYDLENAAMKGFAQGAVFIFFVTVIFIVCHSIFREDANLAQRAIMTVVAFLMVLELVVVFGAIGGSNAFNTSLPTFRGKL
jgi:arsenate reductase (thioredoxin)